jgi:hypothetical protein
MPIEMAAARSRRALLAAAAGAAAATVVSAIDRPTVVRAGIDGDLVLEAKNTTSATTEIESGEDLVDVLLARSTAGGSALVGESALGTGVLGTGTHGIEGSSQGGMGVLGVSETGTGVVGHITLRGAGVQGHSFSAGGIGVLATAAAGTALQVSGKAKFSRSGRATVPKGKSYVDVKVIGGLTSHSVVHATLQAYRPGVAVAAVRKNYPVAGKARIYLTRVASTTADTFVGWFVVEH